MTWRRCVEIFAREKCLVIFLEVRLHLRRCKKHIESDLAINAKPYFASNRYEVKMLFFSFAEF